MHAAVFLGKDSPENLHYVRNGEIVRCDSEIDSRAKFGNVGSVRMKWANFNMGKAVLGERRRSNQAHECKR